MARKKKEVIDLEAAIEMIKNNPELAKLLINNTKQKEDVQNEHVHDIDSVTEFNAIKIKPKQIFFDDPNEGVEEGKWDKKHAKKFKRGQRRPPTKMVDVICTLCHRKNKISETLYDKNESYVCGRCFKR